MSYSQKRGNGQKYFGWQVHAVLILVDLILERTRKKVR
jgi:hypothetical protein